MPETTHPSRHRPASIGFLLVPQFSMMAFLSAVEPLRVANRFGGDLFRWHFFSADGNPVAASNGMTVMTDGALADAGALSMLFVCSGFDANHQSSSAIRSGLRERAAHGLALGAIDTGCFLLADAGLLDGYRVALHWESMAVFAETYPDITLTHGLFEIDRDRYTCAGGTAALDLMLHLIAHHHGEALAITVSDQFLLERIRDPNDDQRMNLYARLGTRNTRLIKAVGIMQRHLEQPLDAQAVADACALSLRQLQRLFARHLNDTPRGYYLKLRLNRARQLLRQTEMSVLQVGVACGFGSVAYFSRAYKARFGRSPQQDRHLGGGTAPQA